MLIEPSESHPVRNRAFAVGTLDRQFLRGRELTVVGVRNELQGREDRLLLQVPSPFGKAYGLPIHIEGAIQGSEILDRAAEGMPLAVLGRLEWDQRIDERYAVEPGTPGRRASELTFHVTAVRPPAADDDPGCDVWLEGIVRTPPRIVRHPYKTAVLLAFTRLQVEVERQRRGSRARIIETEQVPVVIPLKHHDAPNLLRPNNRVIVEGMLERVMINMRGPDVERATAALDTAWTEQSGTLQGRSEEFVAAEKRYARQRLQLIQGVRSRVMAGYVELLEGTPATYRESQDLRHAFVRAEQRRAADRSDTAGRSEEVIVL